MNDEIRMTNDESIFECANDRVEAFRAFGHLDLIRHSLLVIRHSRGRAAGFSFIEIMFAVIILGIGFIMVAALFPVALQQTQATSQDVMASAFANSISQSLSSTLSSGDLYPTGQSANVGHLYPPMYVSFGTAQAAISGVPNSLLGTNPFSPTTTINAAVTPWTLWSKISGSMINSTDPRFGWVGFYSRDESTAAPVIASSFVNVIAIITQNQNPKATGYTSSDLVQAAASQPATLQGWPAQVQIIDSGYAGTGAPAGMVNDIAYVQGTGAAALATGAYIIIAQDSASYAGTYNAGHFNGKIFRVGNRRTDLEGGAYQAWELQSGNDYTPDAAGTPTHTLTIPVNALASGFWANAFIVGRALQNPSAAYAAPNDFVGGSQAIAAYSFTIAVQ